MFSLALHLKQKGHQCLFYLIEQSLLWLLLASYLVFVSSSGIKRRVTFVKLRARKLWSRHLRRQRSKES